MSFRWLTISKDCNASGAINGTWSYNEMDKVLTIGNYKLQVERGTDWETKPREPTIVYSG